MSPARILRRTRADDEKPLRCAGSDLDLVDRHSRFRSADWKDRPVPPREWLVEGLIPHKTVTLFSGDGGTGKSLLSLQLAVAVASGGSFLGKPVKQGDVIVLSVEDRPLR
jgi:RecA-family ATPase